MLQIAADALAAAVEPGLLLCAERKLDHLLHAVCPKAARSKRKRSSVSAQTSSGMPRKLTQDHGTNCSFPCSPSI